MTPSPCRCGEGKRERESKRRRFVGDGNVRINGGRKGKMFGM